MRIKETKVYKYDELSPEAQECARDWWRDGALDYDWWEFVYDDAEQVGLKINEFDIDHYCRGEFIEDAEDVINNILKNHGESCETYKTAKRYQESMPGDEDGLEDWTHEFLLDLLEDYRIMLRDEYNWLLSDEQAAESIECNDYEFDEDGNIA